MNNQDDSSHTSEVDPLAERVKVIQLENSEDSFLSEYADLPNIVIVTNIGVEVFEDSSTRVCVNII